MRLIFVGLVVQGLLLTTYSEVEAQLDPEHKGFWISAGLGAAATFSDPLYDEEGKSAEFGPSLSVRLGGTVNQRLLLGGEITVWNGGGFTYRGNTAFTALFYPSDEGGVFVRGLVGVANRRVKYTVVTNDFQFFTLEESASGLGLGMGLGYDLQLARNFFLTPGVDAGVQYLADHWAPSLILTLSATWH